MKQNSDFLYPFRPRLETEFRFFVLLSPTVRNRREALSGASENVPSPPPRLLKTPLFFEQNRVTSAGLKGIVSCLRTTLFNPSHLGVATMSNETLESILTATCNPVGLLAEMRELVFDGARPSKELSAA